MTKTVRSCPERGEEAHKEYIVYVYTNGSKKKLCALGKSIFLIFGLLLELITNASTL